ncbi:MAG: hypothetical protein K6G90_12460 [Clostridia bacterium]|nr:hypothetical protein [Clostridia bacterium]
MAKTNNNGKKTDLKQAAQVRATRFQHEAKDMSAQLKQMLAEEIAAYKKKEKKRSVEIMGVFAKHNFYTGGFTPVELRTTLEDLGPTYVKIGQIMSSRVDMLPESYCRELEKLRQNVKPLPAEVARVVIEQETGKKIDEIYSEFKDKPLGSASIAQAHAGVLKDGTKVVTKVQRPLIADMMRRDFVLLKKIAAMVNIVAEGYDSGSPVDLMSVILELEKVTEEELDFRVEAENTRFFREHCIESPEVIDCPVIIDDLTTERILTMTFVDGYSISKKERIKEDGYDPMSVGRAIIDNYMHQVLDVGTFHGDPHQGNIMISNGKPFWIDFGMIGHVSEANLNMIQGLLLSLLEKDTEALANTVMSMGGAGAKTNRAKLMEDLDGFLDKYMTVTNVADLDTAVLMEDLMALISEHHVRMPGELTMLVRSLATIEGVIEELCPELNLFELLTKKLMERVKQNFDVQQQLLSLGKDMLEMGKKTAKLPVLISDALNSVVKGRLKANIALTGYDELLDKASGMLKNVILAIFACVLFFGSCVLCMTKIEPQTANGLPLLAVVGFVLSVSLAVYAVKQMNKK